MGWGLDTPVCAGQLAASKLIQQDLRMRDALWWVMGSPSTRLCWWPGSSPLTSCPSLAMLIYVNVWAWRLASVRLSNCQAVVGDLTRELLRRVNHTGSDVRVASGTIINPRNFPRQSAAALWWNWSGVFSCRWCRREHINRLEMRSILLALRWRVTHLKEVSVRFTHLTDSYVCMSIISKGRTSSVMLTSVLRHIAAWAIAFGLFPVLAHVESTENPTDEASRA